MCHHHFTREREPLGEPIEAAEEAPEEEPTPEPELEDEEGRIFVPPADD